jgi:hypothetical protein
VVKKGAPMKLIQEKMRVLAADARRRAVLQGLATLGYEVNEGMATAGAVTLAGKAVRVSGNT